MNARNQLLATSLLFVLASLPCASKAGDWWMTGAAGQRGHRDLYLVDASSITGVVGHGGEGNFRKATVAQVIEPANYPIDIVYELEMKCADHKMRVVSATAHQRDGTTKNLPEQVTAEWAPVPATWFVTSYAFICSYKDGKVADQTVLHLGVSDMDSTLKAIWGTFWSDSNQNPPLLAAAAVDGQETSAVARKQAPGHITGADLDAAITIARNYRTQKITFDHLLPIKTSGPASEESPDWFLIYASGSKPDRHLFFAREYDIRPSADLYQSMPNDMNSLSNIRKLESSFRGAEVAEVLEDAAEPDKIVRRISFRCDMDVAQVVSKVTWLRNSHVPFEQGDAWRKIDSPWLARARLFACDRQARDQGHQIVSVGEVAGKVLETYELSDLSWSAFWRDDPHRPATTSDMTPAQLAKQKADLLQTIKGQLSMIDGLRNGLEGKRQKYAKDIADEPAREAKIRTNLVRRAHTPNPVLETWIDATEDQLVQAWGRPQYFETSTDSRFLSYVRGYVNQVSIMQTGGGVSGVVGQTEESHECTIRFEVRDGKVYNYGVHGDRNQCGLEAFPQGPNVENGRVR